MTSRRDELQKAIIEVQRAPSTNRRRYGNALKRAITEYAMMEQEKGHSLETIATELHLNAASLRKWVRHTRRRQKQGRVPFERYARDPDIMVTRPQPAEASSDPASATPKPRGRRSTPRSAK